MQSMVYILIAIIIVISDQLSKIAAASFLSGQKIIIKGILSFVYVENRGAAFGLFQGARTFFITVTVLALILGAIYVLRKRPCSKIEKTALAFISGGAVGNFIDRAAITYVRDFISLDFINFPVFNIADCFVCIGAALYVIFILREESLNGKNKADSKK